MRHDLRERVLEEHCASNEIARDALSSLFEELDRLRAALTKPATGPTRCPECGELFAGAMAGRDLTDAKISCGPMHTIIFAGGGAFAQGSGAEWQEGSIQEG